MYTAVLTGPFIDPPSDAVAQYPHVPLLLTAGIAVIAAIVGVIYTKRTGSPLFLWATLAGLTLYPFVVEPIGDWFLAVWYPTNLDIAATPFGRPIPWFAVLFYGAGIPLATVGTYEIVKRGLSAKRLIQLIALIAVLELPMEIIGNQYGWMVYYGNHATLFDLPIYCYVQNAGMFAVVAWVLAWLMPRIHGWRWVAVPFALAALLPAYALVATFPAYIAIHAGAGPFWGWTAGIVSTILNAAVVVACIYSPALRRRRESAQDDVTAPGPQPAHAA